MQTTVIESARMSNCKSVVKKRVKKAISTTPAGAGLDDSCLVDVVEKLKRHDEFKTLTDEQLRQKAKQLTDIKELHAEFSHLSFFEHYAGEIAEEEGVSLDHSTEVEKAQFRAVRRLRTPSVKLFLFELRNPTSRFFSRFSQLFSLKYGALHAAIQIGDVVLQWGTSSLVIPERYDPADPVFQTDFKDVTKATQVAVNIRPKVVQAVRRMDYNEQIDLQFDLAVGVEEMLEKVKKVIVKYNKFYQYNVVLRNCQTFVDSVMEEIGVKNAPKQLTGKLREYFKKLTANKSKGVPSDIPTHEALDEYVSTLDLSASTQHDKEYLLCLYFQFHVEAMKTDKDPSEECRVGGCLMERIERDLENMSMLLEKFVAS